MKLTLALLLFCCSSSALASQPPVGPPTARQSPSGIVIEVPSGAVVTLLDAAETLLKSITSTGPVTLGPDGVDPMLRILRVEHPSASWVGPLSDLLPPAELVGVLPDQVSPGMPVSPRIQLVNRKDGEPLADVDGELLIECGGKAVWNATARSRSDGLLVAAGDDLFPVAASGACQFRVNAAGAQLSSNVEVITGLELVLSADRPIYRPGDTVHARAVVLERPSGRPLDAASVRFTLEDESGRIVVAMPATTSAFGVASAALTLPDTVGGAKLQLNAVSGRVTREKSLDLGRFQKAGLEIGLSVPGQVPAGGPYAVTVDARRYDGGPASLARVELTETSPSGAVTQHVLLLDAAGRGTVSLTAPKDGGVLAITARAEVAGGRTGRAETSLFVDAGQLTLYAIPESGHLVQGVVNGIWAVLVDGAGNGVAGATVAVEGASGKPAEPGAVRGTTDEAGLVYLSVPVASAVTLIASKDGRQARRPLTEVKTGALLSVGPALSAPGQPMEATYRSAAPDGTLATFELVIEKQSVHVVTARVEGGVARASLVSPAQIAGTAVVRAYHLEAGGAPVGDARLVLFEARHDLNVTVQLDAAEYRPRATANVTFSVRDQAGRPVDAAVGALAVDAGLRMLGLEQPGIERAVARLGDWGKPAVSTPTWAREGLLMARDSLRLGVLLSAIAVTLDVPNARFTREARRMVTRSAFQPAIDKRSEALGKALSAYFKSTKEARGKPITTDALISGNAAPRGAFEDPWGRPLTITYAPDAECCEHSLTIKSAGVDGAFGNDDDLAGGASFTGWSTCKKLCPSGGFGHFGMGAGGTGTAYANGTIYRFSAKGAARVGLPPVREWFPDTLAVAPELLTGPDGDVVWTLPLADSLTTWVVQGRAVSRDGGLGSVEIELPVTQPVAADMAVEPELVLGDRIVLPVELRNRSADAAPLTITVRASGAASLAGQSEQSLGVRHVAAGETVTIPVEVRADRVGEALIEVGALAPDGRGDRVKRRFDVVSGGVSREATQAGGVSSGGAVTASVAAPRDGIEGTSSIVLRVYAAALGAVVEGLDGLLRVPSGCFEQTSATTYPNALVVGYLKDRKLERPEIRAKAMGLLESGWERLRGYEVKGGGFSWFGDAPANTILTAFGVMEFRRMAELMPIEQEVIRRTRDWLLSKRRADGAWDPDKEYLHAEAWSTVQAGAVPVTAYVTWALAKSGDEKKALAPSVRWLEKNGASATGGYATALVALALEVGGSKRAAAARKRLAALVTRDDTGAFVAAGGPTATHAGDDGAALESTALAALALLAGPETQALGEACVDWLLARRSPGGGWDSTQGTILALDALLTREALQRVRPDGQLVVTTPGGDAALREVYVVNAGNADVVKAIRLPADRDAKVELRFTGTGGLRYQLGAEREVPVNTVKSATAPLTASFSLPDAPMARGKAVTGTLRIVAPRDEVRMPLITVELPAAMDVDMGRLEAQGFDKVELVGRRLAFYLQTLAAGSEKLVELTLTPRRVGTLSGGVVRAQPYYDADKASFAAFGQVTVLE